MFELPDNNRDALGPTSTEDAAPELPLLPSDNFDKLPWSYYLSFVSTALAFPLESVDSTSPEQLQMLEQIIERAAKEVTERKYKTAIDIGLQQVLMKTFQLASRQLSWLDISTPGSKRWLTWCEQVIEVLCLIIGAHVNQKLIWQELSCDPCSGVAAGLVLVTLLRVVAHEECTGATMALTQADEVLKKITLSYAHMPTVLKEFCLKQVTTLVYTIIDEGPLYQFTPRIILQLKLLEHLTAARFLDDSDDWSVSIWINDLFPECFECCGLVLQLLNEQSNSLHSDTEDSVGMVRTLDVCLLVLKAGVDYFKTRRSDVVALLNILAPVVLDALSRLTHRLSISTEAWEKSSSQVRSLETSLYLLAKVGEVIDDSECDVLATVFSNLFAALSLNSNRLEASVMCFDAIDQLLIHPNVSKSLEPRLNVLLQADELRVLREEYLLLRRNRSIESPDMETARQGVCIRPKLQMRDEDGPRLTNSEIVSGLFSGQNKADKIDELVPVGPSSEVVRRDVPQWFDEEDSDNFSDREGDTGIPQQVVDENKDRIVTSTIVPQWFEDSGEDEDAAIELLQCSLGDVSELLELSALLEPAPQTAFKFGRIVEDDDASDDGSIDTEVMTWSDCSSQPSTCSERLRSSSLSSQPS